MYTMIMSNFLVIVKYYSFCSRYFDDELWVHLMQQTDNSITYYIGYRGTIQPALEHVCYRQPEDQQYHQCLAAAAVYGVYVHQQQQHQHSCNNVSGDVCVCARVHNKVLHTSLCMHKCRRNMGASDYIVYFWCMCAIMS